MKYHQELSLYPSTLSWAASQVDVRSHSSFLNVLGSPILDISEGPSVQNFLRAVTRGRGKLITIRPTTLRSPSPACDNW